MIVITAGHESIWTVTMKNFYVYTVLVAQNIFKFH